MIEPFYYRLLGSVILQQIKQLFLVSYKQVINIFPAVNPGRRKLYTR